MAQNLKNKACHILVTGASGTGKSSFLENYIRKCDNDLVLIYDSEGEFAERFKIPPVSTLAELAAAIENPKGSKIIIYFPLADSEPLGEFDDFCLFVFELLKGAAQTDDKPFPFPKGVLMVIDEFQEFCNVWNVSENFARCLQRGRRYGLDLLLASQQPNVLNNCVRTQITELVCFYHADQAAAKFARNFGIDENRIMELPPLRYIRKPQGQRDFTGQIKFEKNVLTISEKASSVTHNETAEIPPEEKTEKL